MSNHGTHITTIIGRRSPIAMAIIPSGITTIRDTV